MNDSFWHPSEYVKPNPVFCLSCWDICWSLFTTFRRHLSLLPISVLDLCSFVLIRYLNILIFVEVLHVLIRHLNLLIFVEVLSHFHRLFESGPDIQRMSPPFDNFFNPHSCITSKLNKISTRIFKSMAVSTRRLLFLGLEMAPFLSTNNNQKWAYNFQRIGNSQIFVST